MILFDLWPNKLLSYMLTSYLNQPCQNNEQLEFLVHSLCAKSEITLLRSQFDSVYSKYYQSDFKSGYLQLVNNQNLNLQLLFYK